MPDTIISFTTIEYPNQEMMDKGHEIFEKEMATLADKLRPQGMIKFHSSRLFLPEGKLMMGNWLEYKDMAAFEVCNKICLEVFYSDRACSCFCLLVSLLRWQSWTFKWRQHIRFNAGYI